MQDAYLPHIYIIDKKNNKKRQKKERLNYKKNPKRTYTYVTEQGIV